MPHQLERPAHELVHVLLARGKLRRRGEIQQSADHRVGATDRFPRVGQGDLDVPVGVRDRFRQVVDREENHRERVLDLMSDSRREASDRLQLGRLHQLVGEEAPRLLRLRRVELPSDQALDRVDRVLRVGEGLALGDLAHQALALRGEADDGGGGARPFLVRDDLGRPALHASRLRFVHPGDGTSREYQSPLPDDISRYIARLRERAR